MSENLFLPDIPASPMFIGDKRIMAIEWQEFFRVLFSRVGGVSGSAIDESLVSNLFSIPENYNKKISELKKTIEALPFSKSYDKIIDELKSLIIANLLNIREPFKFYLPQIVYEDLQISISNIRVPPANAPTERLYDHGIVAGIEFPVLGFAVDDYIYFDIQTYHSMKLASILDNHIHYMTPTDGTGDEFRFQLDVIVAPIDGNWIVPAGSPFTKEVSMIADLSNSHMIEDIADIPGENTTVSTIYKCILTRIDVDGGSDEYAGEIYLEFTDCHFQKDSGGSRNEGSK